MSRTAVFLAAAMLLGAAQPAGVQDHIVLITDSGFAPDRVDLAPGERVVFENRSSRALTVMSLPSDGDGPRQGFLSSVIPPNTSWGFVFHEEGYYAYACREDRSLSGMLVVSAER